MSTADHTLSVEIARKCLGRIGRHPISLQHAFLQLGLSNKSITNIDAVANFPNIMYLDLSNNEIDSLSVLAKLPTLVELVASRNSIKDCLNFSAPLCSLSHSWKNGHNAAGSMLTSVDLSENVIQSITDLSNHRFLEKLILHHNKISYIEGVYGLHYLQVLDLSFNSIATIEGLDDLPLRELRLKGNKICELTGLDKLPNLALLDVSENCIISLSQLAKAKNLVHLDVSHNQIAYIRQCEFLQDIPWLTTLVFNNNPCEQKELYRLRVLYRLPRLLMLDHTEACLENKVRAFNLYHSSNGDLALREEALRRYLPQVPFVDHSPQQLPHDEELDVSLEELLRGLPVKDTTTHALLQETEKLYVDVAEDDAIVV